VCIKAAGGQILSQTDDWVEFTGIDCTSEGIVVMEPEKKVKLVPQDTDVVEAIRSFDLLHSTPLDAVNFVGYLQTLVHR